LTTMGAIVRQKAILGTRARERLEELLKDTSSDRSKHSQAVEFLLGLIGMVLDNRHLGDSFESGNVITRLCHLLERAILTSIPPHTRTTLIYNVALMVKSHPSRSTECELFAMIDSTIH
jgi:hypothetical protein